MDDKGKQSMDRTVWPGSIKRAVELQHRLAKKVCIVPLGKEPVLVAGADSAFHDDRIFAAVCLFRLPGLELLERVSAVQKVKLPYIPGLLSFREGDALLAAFRMITVTPDLILFDGQGIAHPRGLGIASHMGVLLRIPSIGCAKSRLVGIHEEPGPEKGDRVPLTEKDKKIGYVLRTRTKVRPLFVSPGHLVSFEDACRMVLQCTTRYRLPEPVRCADLYAREMKRRQ